MCSPSYVNIKTGFKLSLQTFVTAPSTVQDANGKFLPQVITYYF
jgi:hypothetical protein